MAVFYEEKNPFLWVLGILSDQHSPLLLSCNLRIMPSLKPSFNSSRLLWCFYFIENLLPSENIKSSFGFLATHDFIFHNKMSCFQISRV